MKIYIYLFVTLFAFSVPKILYAGFDWGGDAGNCSGSGKFQQQIKNNDIVEVGEIPLGKEGVSIKLTSDNDVDIQLYDKSTGEKIIVWPNGILSGAGKQTTNYEGINIEWSGYNGDGTNYGHEYINISGTTNRTLIMKAFGYKAGFANVDYLWTGTQGCTEGSSTAANGSGTFQQQILHQATVTVGDIPTDIDELSIQLISDNDVDIQLYDKDNGIEIIAWPNGILNAANKQTTSYKGMNIEWSGYNGDGINYGHEYIKISGVTTQNLTMKAFGYKAGYATINYSWGSETTSGNDIELDLRSGQDNSDILLSESSIPASSCTFKDVDQSQWYAKYVNALCSSGIIVGYYTNSGAEYRPSNPANWAEVSKVINLTYDHNGSREYCGTIASTWYKCYLNLNEAKGFTNRSADSKVRRGIIFQYIAKIFWNTDFSTYSSAGNFLKNKGVVSNPENTNDFVQRDELAKMALVAASKTGKKIPYGLVPQPNPDKPFESDSDLPKSSTPTPISSISSNLGSDILTKAKETLGKTGYPYTDNSYTYCARHVRMLYSKPASGHAYQICNNFSKKGLIKNSGIPTAGAVVCYNASTPGSGNYGHIAISTGSGNEIGVTSLKYGVTERKIKSDTSYYMGWITPNNFRDHY